MSFGHNFANFARTDSRQELANKRRRFPGKGRRDDRTGRTGPTPDEKKRLDLTPASNFKLASRVVDQMLRMAA